MQPSLLLLSRYGPKKENSRPAMSPDDYSQPRKPPSFFFTNKENTPKAKRGDPDETPERRKVQFLMPSEANYDRNPTPLYKAIEAKDWDSAIELVELKPTDACTWIFRNERDGTRVRWRLLPVHAAIIFKAPDELIKALLNANPEATKNIDDQGMTPLHLAFRYGSGDAVIFELLNVFPEAIEIKDKKGRVPMDLHNLVTKGEPSGGDMPKTPKSMSSNPNTPKNKWQQSGFATYVNVAVDIERKKLEAELRRQQEDHREQMSELRLELKAARRADDNPGTDLFKLREAYRNKAEEVTRLNMEKSTWEKRASDLERTLSSLEDQVSSSRQVDNELIGSMVDRERNLKKAIGEKEAELDKLWHLLDSVEKDNEDLTTKVAELEETNDMLERQKKSHCDKDDELKEGMREIEQQMTQYLEVKEEEVKKLEMEQEHLRQKNAVYLEKVQELEETLSTQRQEVYHAKELKEDYEQIVRKNSSLKDRLNELEVSMADLNERKYQVELLEDEYEHIKRKHSDLTDRLQEVEDECVRYKDQLASANEELLLKETEMLEVKSASESLLSHFQLKTEREMQFEGTLDELSRELKDAMEAKELEMQCLYEKNGELIRKNADCEEKIHELEGAIGTYEDQISRVREGREAELSELRNNYEGEMKELREDKLILGTECEHLTNMVQEVSSKNVTLEEKVERLKGKVQTLAGSLLAMTHEHKSIVDAVEKQEEGLQSSMHARERMMEEVMKQMADAQASAEAKRQHIIERASRQKKELVETIESMSSIDSSSFFAHEGRDDRMSFDLMLNTSTTKESREDAPPASS